MLRPSTPHWHYFPTNRIKIRTNNLFHYIRRWANPLNFNVIWETAVNRYSFSDFQIHWWKTASSVMWPVQHNFIDSCRLWHVTHIQMISQRQDWALGCTMWKWSLPPWIKVPGFSSARLPHSRRYKRKLFGCVWNISTNNNAIESLCENACGKEKSVLSF